MRGRSDIVARIAHRQHGRVARRQLLAAGLSGKLIDRWVADGRLRVVHRGVYAVGHTAPSVQGTYMAAVLAAGPGARLSHRAAEYLWSGARGTPPPPEVTVPTTADRRRPGIVIHRVARLQPLDVTTLHAIPITTLARTLLDVAPRTSPPKLARACHEAWVRHRLTPVQIDACIARNPRKPGVARLRTALGSDATLSDLEDGFLALLDAHDLPRPRTNVDRHGDKVDCHWPAHGLTVELVTFRYHATRDGFESDVARRRRSNHVAYTYGDVFERGPRTAAEIAARLAAGAGAEATGLSAARRR